MKKINLGDTVKCKYTGFKGVAVARIEFINGCIQYCVAPKWDGKSHNIEDMGIDEKSLEVVKRKPKPKQKPTGGASTLMKRHRGY